MKQEDRTKLTKEKIITVAIEEFGTKGYALASINNVSGAGISKGLIYHNFENKDALYLECLQLCFNKMVDKLSKTTDSDSYEDYMKARYIFFEENRFKANMILEALIHPPEPLKNEITCIRKSYDEMNSAFFERILNARNLRDGVNKENAMKYFTMLQDMFNWYYCNPRLENQTLESTARMHEENLPQMIEYMLYGIIKEEKTC